MSFVTFIVPTVGRATLQRAVDSVKAQTLPFWDLYIEGDGVDPYEALDFGPSAQTSPGAIHAWKQHHHKHESDMRNIGIRQARSEWVAFLDDDDTLAPQYVEWLLEAADNSDVVIFRQIFPKEDGTVAVFPNEEEIVWGNVGISYAVKRSWALTYPFKRSLHEDLLHLVALEAGGANITFSPHIAYYGRDHRG